jgi:pimeloyl-ACP methyl ester carboxylesterase
MTSSSEVVELTGRDGIRLVADAAGDRDSPPVVLAHGGGQTRHSWGTTLRVLAERGWRAYAVDLRGHGDSGWDPDGDYSMDAFAADVRAVARSFSQPPVLVGASLGGLSCMVAVAETDPSDRALARALVLVDVAPRIEPQGRDRIGAFMMQHLEDGFGSLEEVADAIQAYNPHRPRPRDLAGLKKNVRMRDDGRWVWHWDPQFITGQRGSPDETRSSLVDAARLQDAARALAVPTLLVRGRQSDLLSQEGAREFLELAPHAEYADVAEAGHMVAGDRNDAFNDAVVHFLDAVAGRR